VKELFYRNQVSKELRLPLFVVNHPHQGIFVVHLADQFLQYLSYTCSFRSSRYALLIWLHWLIFCLNRETRLCEFGYVKGKRK
jgi:hypothetical protein